jgi:hypothetical protein
MGVIGGEEGGSGGSGSMEGKLIYQRSKLLRLSLLDRRPDLAGLGFADGPA